MCDHRAGRCPIKDACYNFSTNGEEVLKDFPLFWDMANPVDRMNNV